MSSQAMMDAWMEKSDGGRIPVAGNLSFGRIAGNEVVLPDERISRRHAIIHSQGDSEFWLVDLGSRNGTYVNDRRVNLPVHLRDLDQIRIGRFSFVFRQPGTESSATVLRGGSPTLIDVRAAPCWLLVADVQGSTALAQCTSPDDLAVQMGQWFLHCQKLIEASHGTLNKYLGDGFLAFWQSEKVPDSGVVSLLSELNTLQKEGRPDFRFVLHHGNVQLGGGGSMGEDSLSGPAVNFVFRMEKLAGSLGCRRLMSVAATQQLRGRVPLEPAGEHPLAGFDGNFPFFAAWP